MIGFTFEVIKRDYFGLYDLFSNTVVDFDIERDFFIVEEKEEARMDLISLRLYGSIEYIEELMMINNILNPFSIKQGDIITYVSFGALESFHDTTEKIIKSDKKKKKNKSTRQDPKRPPTIRPENFEQVLISKDNKTLKLNTRVS